MSESSEDNKPTKLKPLNEPIAEAIAEIPEAAEVEIRAVTAAAEEVDPDGSLAFSELVALEVQAKRADIAHEEELHRTRKTYTSRLFWLIVSWLSVVVLFVALTATLKPYFNVSDSVLIAFITSTTVSVLGLFMLVAKWLFPQPTKDENKSLPKK
jgi:hypothetical protein